MRAKQHVAAPNSRRVAEERWMEEDESRRAAREGIMRVEAEERRRAEESQRPTASLGLNPRDAPNVVSKFSIKAAPKIYRTL